MDSNDGNLFEAKTVLKTPPLKANIGCGLDYRQGWFNCDILDVKKDMQINLNKFPWPIKSNSFELVYMFGVLEHLHDTAAVAKEVYRILKPGGIWQGSVPYCFSRSAYRDPTHLKFFDIQAFDYFTWDWCVWAGQDKFQKKYVRLANDNGPKLHKLRNFIFPLWTRKILTHFILNMFEYVEWELVKPDQKQLKDYPAETFGGRRLA